MNRTKTAFAALIDKHASEAWMFWIAIGGSILIGFIPEIEVYANRMIQPVFPDLTLGLIFQLTVAGYVGPRMVSKAAKAPPRTTPKSPIRDQDPTP